MKCLVLEVVGIQSLQKKNLQLPAKTGWIQGSIPASGDLLHESRAETPLVRATGRKWSRMKENPFRSPITGFSATFGMTFFGWGQRRQTPSFIVCVFIAKFPVMQNSLYPGQPRGFFHSCCWNKNKFPCVRYPHLSSSFVAVLPEHIKAFKKLISHKLLLGHVLRR